MKKSILLHNMLHVLLPFFLIYIIVRGNKVNLTDVAITIFFGSFFPDFDHFLMYERKTYKSFWNFLKFCLRAERFRKGFLIFHNDLALLFVAIGMFILRFINFYLMLFLFAIFAHLVYDYLTDLLLIKTYKHWRFKI